VSRDAAVPPDAPAPPDARREGPDVMIVPHGCTGLPAPGTWEFISPPELTAAHVETFSTVVNVSDQSVYAAGGAATNGGSGGTGVLHSTNCGASGSWTRASTGTGSDRIMTGDPWAMVIDPSDPRTLYVDNGYGDHPTIYKSTDGGVNWTALSPDPAMGTSAWVQAIALDPNEPQHVAVTLHYNCGAPINGECFSSSTDGGAHWTLFRGPTGGWEEGVSLTVLGPMSYLYAGPTGAYFTADGGANWSHPVTEGLVGTATTIAPDGALYLSGGGTVYVSRSTPLGSAFQSIPNTPHITMITNDGVNLYGSNTWGGPHPMWTAPLSNPAMWTNMSSPEMSRGSNAFSFDPVHHILYAANMGAGLWRMVTR
jgi:hypothetical protein